MREGLQKEGCREEGDLSGYNASSEHVILWVLSQICKRTALRKARAA